MTNLLSYRQQFDSLKNCHYLIANSLGAMPNSAKDWSDKYLNLWQHRGVRAWDDEWWPMSREVGNKIGRLINAPNDSISMQPNVTSAQATILSCFDFASKRNKVVMVEQEFPSLLYLYERWLEGNGKLEIIKCPTNMTAPIDKLLTAIDNSTALVSISQVLFRSSYIVNAQAIIEKAHQVGAKVMLDVFQSIGVLPIDVKKLNVDFAVGGCLKWLCGGPGACFLYVRPDLNDSLKPRFTGWLAHESPFDFDNTGMKYTSGSYRFLNGTPVVPALYTCQGGLDIVSEIGVEQIRQRSLEMTSRLIEKALENNWQVYTPQKTYERAGTVSIGFPNALAISKELLKRNFLIDYRPHAGIRVSPHFYNTDEEIDELIQEIQRINRK